MTGITTYLSMVTLNVYGLTTPSKHTLANWIKKEDTTICCIQEKHLIDTNKHWLRVKVWKQIDQANGPQNEAKIAIIISEKVDYKLTLIK
jgi:exonuclease III